MLPLGRSATDPIRDLRLKSWYKGPPASMARDVIQLIQLNRLPIMLTSSGTLIFGIPLLSLVVIWRLYQIRRAFGHFSHFPTYSTLVSPVYPLGRTLPRIPWVALGSNFGWRDVYECKLPTSMIVGTLSLTWNERVAQRCLEKLGPILWY